MFFCRLPNVRSVRQVHNEPYVRRLALGHHAVDVHRQPRGVVAPDRRREARVELPVHGAGARTHLVVECVRRCAAGPTPTSRSSHGSRASVGGSRRCAQRTHMTRRARRASLVGATHSRVRLYGAMWLPPHRTSGDTEAKVVFV